MGDGRATGLPRSAVAIVTCFPVPQLLLAHTTFPVLLPPCLCVVWPAGFTRQHHPPCTQEVQPVLTRSRSHVLGRPKASRNWSRLLVPLPHKTWKGLSMTTQTWVMLTNCSGKEAVCTCTSVPDAKATHECSALLVVA